MTRRGRQLVGGRPSGHHQGSAVARSSAALQLGLIGEEQRAAGDVERTSVAVGGVDGVRGAVDDFAIVNGHLSSENVGRSAVGLATGEPVACFTVANG